MLTAALHALPGWAYQHAAVLLGCVAALICVDILVQVCRPDRYEPEPEPPVSPLLEWLARWGRSWDSATPPAGDDFADVPPPLPIQLDAYTDNQPFMPAAEVAPAPEPEVSAKRTVRFIVGNVRLRIRARTLWLWYTPPPVELTDAERHERSLSAVIAGGIPGRHKPPRWRTRLNGWLHQWWATTTPRAHVQAKTSNTPVALRWRQPTPRIWQQEVVAAHEVDITPSPQLNHLADGWQNNLPDPDAGTFFTDTDIVLQGAT